MTKKLEQKLDKEINTFMKQTNVKHPHFQLQPSMTTTYKNFLQDKMSIIAAIRTGIPYSLFDLIKDSTPFSENDWANFLELSTKSLHRYKQAAKSFKPIQSEKIIEMAEVTRAGLDVFGDMDRLKLWLNTPNFALGKLKPMELLRDSYGKEMVMGELTRIEHGILA